MQTLNEIAFEDLRGGRPSVLSGIVQGSSQVRNTMPDEAKHLYTRIAGYILGLAGRGDSTKAPQAGLRVTGEGAVYKRAGNAVRHVDEMTVEKISLPNTPEASRQNLSRHTSYPGCKWFLAAFPS